MSWSWPWTRARTSSPCSAPPSWRRLYDLAGRQGEGQLRIGIERGARGLAPGAAQVVHPLEADHAHVAHGGPDHEVRMPLAPLDRVDAAERDRAHDYLREPQRDVVPESEHGLAKAGPSAARGRAAAASDLELAR